MSLQNNYVNICNWAHEALVASDKITHTLSDDEIFELQELVREEANVDGGRSLTILIVQAVIDADAAFRRVSRK
jgi:hypothetical protein